MPQPIVFLLTPIAVLVGLLAFASPGEAGGGGHGGCPRLPRAAQGETVSIKDNCFTAAVIHIEPNATVTWTNQDEVQHNVTFFDGRRAADESFLEKGDSVSASFEAPGIYPYYCSLHPAMLGVVAVDTPVHAGVTAQGPGQPRVESATEAPSDARSSSPPSAMLAGLVLATGLVAAGGGYLLRGRRR